VLFEDYAVLKLYRRLNSGPHPEIEMTAFLAERAGFANVPPPLATAEIVLPGAEPEEPSALAVLFGFVRNQGDGWTLALDYLTRYLDDALVETAPGSAVPGRAAELPNPHDFFVMLARQLGLRTAEMHRALAEHGDPDPAFAPEPVTHDDIARWRNALDAAAEAMLDQLEQLGGSLPSATRELADRLIASRQALFRAIRLLLPADVAAVKTRCHGDLHLGQVIAVQNDFYIIDFEGEPLRSIEERRRKGSPLRDVAGMIRSFDYAATAAVRQLGETRPAAILRMTELADAWRQRAVDGFRAAYRKAMRGCPAYPSNKLQARALIDWFTLEKAVYEVSYELANRPGWVSIPLNGILRTLAKVTGSPNGEAL
jgi:maltose alpha-D-glucosyltransferase/alpha-amylase